MTLPQYVGSIDQGTSSTRFILFDQNGNIVRSAQIELKQIHVDGKPGWAEHDPLEIIESVEWCINKVLTDHPPILASQVLSIGITNQRETTVAWDRITGKPLHNALVWHDTRTRELVDEMIQRYPQLGVDRFRASAGLPLSTYFSALKMKWLIMNVPSVEEALNANRCLFGTIDSWLIWNLSGGAIHPDRARHVTDVSNASRTMLMNLKTLKWDQQNCDEFSIPMSILPTILSNSEVYAPVAVGPLAGVPIAGCIGDQQSAMLGQLCFSVGSAKATYGTGCFMLLNTGNQPIQSNHGLLTTVCFQLGPKKDCIFALEGSVAVAGSGVRWLRDEMKLISKASEIDELASAVPDSNDVYMVPAFSGLLSPYWRSDARGVITGLTHSSSRHHLARAVLDAAAYQTGDVLHSMESDTRDKGIKLSLLKVDGGMCASNLLMQFQSDLLQIPVHRPFSLEATASGAAFAAGLATGFWKDERDLIEKVSTHPNTRIFQPLMSIEQRDELYRGWKKSVERTFGWIQPNHTPISSTSSPSSPSSTILSTSTSLPSSTPTPPPTLSSQFRKLSSTRFLSHFALFSIGIMVGLGINSIRKKH